ncbi:hypothetical protein FBZ85_1102 [Azospirillum brasilense]|uniref:Uncharacterized protein n=2 Tax=Azospirillum baldaniorum TaxID=1064539 RepID=A0A9P1NPQ7_9PROT|nr:hypothetical protein FBZ84_11988 [Azospirillum baldaniorum]TWA75730.1 hypothetical protein FBZ85_1102 [Azospirillum brasilense]CCD01046.1 protein of unknown function [Azospirillum baldaniorum]
MAARQRDDQQVATQALADCEGSKDDALLLLAYLLTNARRQKNGGHNEPPRFS